MEERDGERIAQRRRAKDARIGTKAQTRRPLLRAGGAQVLRRAPKALSPVPQWFAEALLVSELLSFGLPVSASSIPDFLIHHWAPRRRILHNLRKKNHA